MYVYTCGLVQMKLKSHVNISMGSILYFLSYKLGIL